MSDLVALFVLGMCTFYSVWLSMEFSPRSKLHLLWTIPVGFFGCFAALAIFSLAVSQADDFLLLRAASALFCRFLFGGCTTAKNSRLCRKSRPRRKCRQYQKSQNRFSRRRLCLILFGIWKANLIYRRPCWRKTTATICRRPKSADRNISILSTLI